MWSTFKAGLTVVGKNIPVGIGIAVGATIATAGLSMVGRGLSSAADSVNKKIKDRKHQKAVEMATEAAAAGAVAS